MRLLFLQWLSYDGENGLKKPAMKQHLLRMIISTLPLIGLWMVLPFFSADALSLQWANTQNTSLGLGVYGLAFFMLQPLWFFLKQRCDERKIMGLCLILFIVGSLLAGFAYSIDALIVGRFLQGAGLIYGLYAGPIGFVFALLLGSILTHFMPLQGLFLVAAGLGLIGLLLCFFLSPVVDHSPAGQFLRHTFTILYKNPQTRILILGALLLPLLLIATFTMLPSLIHGHSLYLNAILLAVLIMVLLIMIARWFKQSLRIMTLCTLMIAIAEIFLAQPYLGGSGLFLCTFIFFAGFISLEILLPSMMLPLLTPEIKKSAWTIFAMMQGLGAFLGAVLAVMIDVPGAHFSIFVWCVVISALWFLYAMRFQK